MKWTMRGWTRGLLDKNRGELDKNRGTMTQMMRAINRENIYRVAQKNMGIFAWNFFFVLQSIF
jgi:hypothetical protein